MRKLGKRLLSSDPRGQAILHFWDHFSPPPPEELQEKHELCLFVLHSISFRLPKHWSNEGNSCCSLVETDTIVFITVPFAGPAVEQTWFQKKLPLPSLPSPQKAVSEFRNSQQRVPLQRLRSALGRSPQNSGQVASVMSLCSPCIFCSAVLVSAHSLLQGNVKCFCIGGFANCLEEEMEKNSMVQTIEGETDPA